MGLVISRLHFFLLRFKSPRDSNYLLTQRGSFAHPGLRGQEGHLDQIVPPRLHLMGKGNSPKENPEALAKVDGPRGQTQWPARALGPHLHSTSPLDLSRKASPFLSQVNTWVTVLGKCPGTNTPRMFIAALSVIVKLTESAWISIDWRQQHGYRG